MMTLLIKTEKRSEMWQVCSQIVLIYSSFHLSPKYYPNNLLLGPDKSRKTATAIRASPI